MRFLQKFLIASAMVLGTAAAAPAAILDAPVPDNATFIDIGNNLQWAWGSPVAGDGSYGGGAIDLSFQGPLGWRMPTAADLLLQPTGLDFQFAGANVPLGGSDPVSGALFEFDDALLTGSAACAAPYFNNNFMHCDWGNAPGTLAGPQPWWPDAGFDEFSESLVVRDYMATPMPEPAALGLIAIGAAGLAFARRRKV